MTTDAEVGHPVITQRQEQAAEKQAAINNRIWELLEEMSPLGSWLVKHGKGHPLYAEKKAAYDALKQQEEELALLNAQFRFPFKTLWFTLPEGLAAGNGRTEIKVVADLSQHLPDRSGADLEGLYLPEDARFLLADALRLL